MILTKDKDKHILPTELKDMFGINSNYSSKMWENIIKQIDLNGDGMVILCFIVKIQFNEFKNMMLKFLD